MTDRIRIIVFNVDHGDSIVVETVSGDSSTWLVVDCNVVRRGGERVNPACDYLKRRKVRELNTVVVTHFHRDHYAGMDEILEGFDVKRLFIPPFLSRNEKLLKQIISRCKRQVEALARQTDDPIVLDPAMSLAKLLRFIRKNENVVEEVTGPNQHYKLSSDVDLAMFLPLKAIRGIMHARLSGDFSLEDFGSHNEASIAVCLEYAGRKALLAGDTERAQWMEHKRRLARDNISGLQCDIVKAPHHGSKHNNREDLFDYFLNSGNRDVIVSANGTSHPHAEFYQQVEGSRLSPYCTNLAPSCESDVLERLPTTVGLPREVTPFLANYARPRVVPCQGDIVVDIDSAGVVSISSTVASQCPFRPLATTKRIGLSPMHMAPPVRT